LSWILPWFASGDPLAPDERSLIHSYFGDFYQSYDLISRDSPLPGGLYEYRKINNSNIFIPDGNHLLIDRYCPYTYPTDRDYSLTYWEWLQGFIGYTNLGGNIAAPAVEVTFPLSVPSGCTIHYLHLDYSIPNTGEPSNQCLSRSRQRVDSGQWMIPDGVLVVANSVAVVAATGERIDPDWDQYARIALLDSEWILPNPSDLPIPLTDDQRLVLSVEEITTGTITYPWEIIDRDQEGQILGSRCTEIGQITSINHQFYTAEEIQDLLDSGEISADEENGWFVFNVPPEGSCAAFSAIRFIDDPWADRYLESGLTPPEIPPSAQWILIEYDPGGVRRLCEDLIGADPISNISVSFNFTYLDNHTIIDSPYFSYFRSANNNPWDLQPTVDIELGNRPSLYLDPQDTNFSGVRLKRDRGALISQSFRSIETLNENNSEDIFTNFTYFDCNLGDITVSRLTQNLVDSIRVVETVLDPEGNPNTDLTRLNNFFVVVDQFWLANNGQEFIYDMPDSLRVKTIAQQTEDLHRSLQADFWKDPFGPFFPKGNAASYFFDKESAELFLESYFNNSQTADPLSFADYITTQIKLLSALIGVHLLPQTRRKIFAPFRGDQRAERKQTIRTLFEQVFRIDKDLFAVLGRAPGRGRLWSKLTDQGLPSFAPISNLMDGILDLITLVSRNNSLLERIGVSTTRTQALQIAQLRAVGGNYERAEQQWDYGSIIVPEYVGGADLHAAMSGIAVHLAGERSKTIPPEISQAYLNRLQQIIDAGGVLEPEGE